MREFPRTGKRGRPKKPKHDAFKQFKICTNNKTKRW